MRYSLEEAARATGGISDKETGRLIEGVSTDTRTIKSNDLFFALEGDTHDGHDYLKNIDDCAAAVVSRRQEGLSFPQITVKDTLKALGDFAAFHKKHFTPVTTGVTGSVGKTSVKEMTASLLEALGPCVKTHANFNNEIGLPLTLFKVNEDTKNLVVEMGMRGSGQIDYLCGIARPDIGIITNIGLTHIELLKTQDNIAAAKAELLRALPETGAAFVNWDGGSHELLRSACCCRLFSFGANPRADLFPEDPDISQEGIRFTAVTPFGRLEKLFIPSMAEHNMINSLAAVGCALYLGVTEGDIRERLAGFKNAEKRFNVVTTPSGLTVIDDTYNANPASMTSALRTLAGIRCESRIAVLGDMLELGDYSEELHSDLGRTVAELGIDRLYCVGPLSRFVAAGAEKAGMDPGKIRCFDSSGLLSENMDAGDFSPGDCVLIKGSRSMKMERISLLLVNM